jgi:hypothetical protein
MLNLGQLIAELKKHDPDLVVPNGFHNAHSYRGYYDQLAFEREDNVTVGAMLETAEGALNKVFHGYKGGDYKMSEWTECWLATYGSTGSAMSLELVRYMLAEAKTGALIEKPPKANSARELGFEEGRKYVLRALRDFIDEYE